MKGMFWISLALFTALSVKASDLVEVVPITPRVLALHFKDGYVQYHGYHEAEEDDVVVSSPLDLYRAGHFYAYHLFSPDDPDYLQGQHPLRIGRKSKPTSFSRECLWTGEICDNEYVSDHWIYLQLPGELKSGYQYTLWVGNLADNLDELSFEFDETRMRSELIHVNQHGYTPSARMKYAYLAHWAGDFGPIDLDFLEGASFYLLRVEDHSVAYEGTISTCRRKLGDEEQDFGSPATWGTTNNVFASDVWEVDFSEFNTPGEYRLVVEGVGCSFPFSIDENVYREAYYYTARGLYYQRAGIAKEEAYAGQWAQPRDHHPADGLTKLYYSSYPSVLSGESHHAGDSILAHVEQELSDWGWGWYHDAGDWDGYLHHTDVPFFLLASYELAPQNFRDHELNIPESGNGIPDILDEAAWLINYFRRNQQPDGGIAGGRVQADFVEGGKPASSPSYEDDRPWYVTGPDPHTCYLFAGLAAQYAYCLEMAGISDSTPDLLAEAQAAYDWAAQNHDIGPEEKVKGAGIEDLRMYAAASLYKLTAEGAYLDAYKALNRVDSEVAGLTGGDYNQKWAVWTFITTPDHPGIDASLKDMHILASINFAKSDFLEPARKRSARMGYSWNKPAVVGSTTTPINMAAMYAQHVALGQEKADLIDYMHTTADYFLGNNPLNTSWISGLGDRHPERMLHLDSRYNMNRVDEIVPGLVPYGPLRHGDHFQGEEAQGPWDADFAKIRSYPDRYEWPVSEFWFDNPYSVLDGEFTIHQTNAPAASSYGFLAADTTRPFSPNTPPALSILSPVSGTEINERDSLKLEWNVSDLEGMSHIQVFLDHHLVHTATGDEDHAALAVRLLPPGTYQLRLSAVDLDGMESWAEGPQLTISHNYQPALRLSPDPDTLSEGQALEVEVDLSAFSSEPVAEVSLYLNGVEQDRLSAAPYLFQLDSVYPLFNEVMAVVRFEAGFESSAKIQKYARPGVAGVVLKKKEIELHSGEYHILEYEIIPDEAENREVSFSSLNESVATVDPVGMIHGVGEGLTEVLIRTVERAFTDTALVHVLPPRPEGPYEGEALLLPAVIEAEHYDYGGEGSAYHDLSAGNSEAAYRFEDVDVGKSYDHGATAYQITGVEAGEWVNYSIFVPETNWYDFRFRYTGKAVAPSISLKSDGEELTTVILPLAEWYPFEEYTAEDILLREGEQVLTLHFNNGPFTLNYVEVSCEECTSILPTDINLNYHDLDVAVGGRVQLLASFYPSNTSNKQLYWKSIGEDVISVDPNGMLTALAVGQAAVVVESEARGLTDTCFVRVLAESAFSPGLNYEYFEGEWESLPDFSSMDPVKIGRVSNFDISPAEEEDLFGFRFYGEISIFKEGDYHFYTSSDDGSRLFLNGELIVDNDGLHAAMEQGGSIHLDSGRHQIEVLYFEKGGGQVLEVGYDGPEISKALIPDSILGTYIVGGELTALEGFVLPDTIWVPLGGKAWPGAVFEPAEASDQRVDYQSDHPEIMEVNAYHILVGLGEGEAELIGITREASLRDTARVVVFNDLPAVRILEPVDGDIFSDQDSLELIFEAMDTVGGLFSLELWMDGSVVMSGGPGTDTFELDPLPEGSYAMEVSATDVHGATGISNTVNLEIRSSTDIPNTEKRTNVIRAIPNPFSEEVRFQVFLHQQSALRFKVYDLAGQLQYQSSPYQLTAGEFSLLWDGRGAQGKELAPGAYICEFLLGNEGNMETTRLIVISK